MYKMLNLVVLQLRLQIIENCKSQFFLNYV